MHVSRLAHVLCHFDPQHVHAHSLLLYAHLPCGTVRHTLKERCEMNRFVLNFTMIHLPFAILLLLYIPFVCALLPLNGTSTPTLDVSDSPSSCSNTRTLWDIIWSCAATLFACTWTAIHPNIPGMEERKLAVFSRRLGIMMIALIAPELMITWATLQFLSAYDTAKDFNNAFGVQLHRDCGDNPIMGESTATLLSEIPTSDRRNGQHLSAPQAAGRDFREWTVTHGFFAWMGGFMLYVNDEPRATLRPNELKRLVHDGSVDMPVIAEADIEDRSKGDALSKGVAVLQLAWFLLQLVVRYAQNLPMTLLEIDTLAVASLTSIAYGFWWKKPKDVGRPYVVHLKPTVSPPSKLAYDKAHAIFSKKDWWYYLILLIYPFGSLMGSKVPISPGGVRERRVPSLGGYEYHDLPARNPVIMLFIGCFSGMVFGGMHCLGWNFLFQRHAEQILWRMASLVIVSTPVSILLSYGCLIWVNSQTTEHDVSAVTVVAVYAMFFTAFASMFIYIIARVTLLVLILLNFRSLPPGVYDTVAWTKCIPHL
ncbi:hypothetical protein EDB19DRAFT_2024604 [Suillus lakei]|nr:hypothetical protein EDB19DRAFT_2024604 [Suillus lakei]